MTSHVFYFSGNSKLSQNMELYLYLDKVHVDLVDVWSLLSIDFDVDVVLVHDFANLEFNKGW